MRLVFRSAAVGGNGKRRNPTAGGEVGKRKDKENEQPKESTDRKRNNKFRTEFHVHEVKHNQRHFADGNEQGDGKIGHVPAEMNPCGKDRQRHKDH